MRSRVEIAKMVSGISGRQYHTGRGAKKTLSGLLALK
jgi:hypothetical protein